jgi:two-component system, LytTR family, response regulator
MAIKTAFIVEDELQSAVFLSKILAKQFPGIHVAGHAADVESGLRGIKEHHPDILFLDIQLKGESGFDLLNRLSEFNFALIFTTAYDQYAIKAFRFNAIDYLLKPIVTGELVEAVNKVQRKSTVFDSQKPRIDQLYSDFQNPQKLPDRIAVPAVDGFNVILLKDIVYCKASGNYTEFYLTDGKCIISSYTLKQYDDLLTPLSFFRSHRSYLINMSHVKKYKKGIGGEIIMSNGVEIELSQTHKDEFLHLLNIR